MAAVEVDAPVPSPDLDGRASVQDCYWILLSVTSPLDARCTGAGDASLP